MITIYENIEELLTLAGAAQKQGKYAKESDLSIFKNAAMVVKDGRVTWVGPRLTLPKSLIRNKKAKRVKLNSRTVAPGLIECHTHSIFGGHRAEEFELRNQGVSYQEIAARGGGILSTLRKTRGLSLRVLTHETREKLLAFARQGVTTVEVKTGYALNEKDELKCLKVLRDLSEDKKLPRVVPTYLGAHAIPPEYAKAAEYLNEVVIPLLSKIKKLNLSQRADIFVENGFFDFETARAYLKAAKDLGFDLTIHADQLSLSGGSLLSVEFAAKSADHVIQISDNEISLLATSDTTSVLLPAADLYMKCAYPPARKLIDGGARVALATDFNPGSSPTQDVSLVGLLARLKMKMTLPEVIVAYTVGAAHALGLEKEVGSLEPGKQPDFFVSDKEWKTFFYEAGGKFACRVFKSGKEIRSLSTSA